MLTQAQKLALATALRAEVDPTVVQAMSIGNAVFLQEWCNGLSAQDAWMVAARRDVLFEAMNINQFDTLTQGKRDSWRLLLEQAGIQGVDFRKQKYRNGVVDIWGQAQADSNILPGVVEKARRAELYLTPAIPANLKTTGAVMALDRTFFGTLTHTEISQALNENP